MTQITPLRRSLESAGYTEINPDNESFAQDYLLYLNNTDTSGKDIAINTTTNNAFNLEPNTVLYNDKVGITEGGTKVVATVGSGSPTGVDIDQQVQLGRPIRIEVLDADPNTTDWGNILVFTSDNTWVQDTIPMHKLLRRYGGFDGNLRLRVHYPRIITGAKLKVKSVSSVSSTPSATYATELTNTKTYPLDANSLLGGYIDIVHPLGVNSQSGLEQDWDQVSQGSGDRYAGAIGIGLTFSIVNSAETITSPTLTSDVTVLTARRSELNQLSNDGGNIWEKLEYYKYTKAMGTVTYKYKDAIPSNAHVITLASSFDGRRNTNDTDLGAIRGKRYVELSLKSTDPNATLGIMNLFKSRVDNEISLSKILTIANGKLYKHGVATNISAIQLMTNGTPNVFMFAVDLDLGELRFGMNGKWWDGSTFSSASFSTIQPTEYLDIAPETTGFEPVKYGFSTGSVQATAVLEEVIATTHRSSEYLKDTQYDAPQGYIAF